MTSALASRLMLKHLRLIAAVVEHGQLSIAAQALGMTQPAASRTLAQAEAQVGSALFDRNARGMVLTDVGEALARRARNIVDELADASEEVELLRLGRGGVVRIGAVTGAAVGYVVPAIRQLKRLAPGAEVHVRIAASEELIAELLAQRHDLVMSRIPPSTPSGRFVLHRAAGERVFLVVRGDNPAVGRGPVSLVDLVHQEWVMQGPGTPIRRAVEEAFLSQGSPLPRNVTNTTSLLMTLALLRDPEVVTAVSQEVALLLTESRSDLIILPLRDPILLAPYSLVTLRDRRLSPVAARCRDLIKALVAST